MRKATKHNINGSAAKVTSLLVPKRIEEVVDANGKKIVH